MSIEKILHKAADVIETRGWCKFTREDPDGKVCLIGAVGVAVGGDPMRHVTLSILSRIDRLARALYPERFESNYVGSCAIGAINDRILRTQAEAIELLRSDVIE